MQRLLVQRWQGSEFRVNNYPQHIVGNYPHIGIIIHIGGNYPLLVICYCHHWSTRCTHLLVIQFFFFTNFSILIRKFFYLSITCILQVNRLFSKLLTCFFKYILVHTQFCWLGTLPTGFWASKWTISTGIYAYPRKR